MSSIQKTIQFASSCPVPASAQIVLLWMIHGGKAEYTQSDICQGTQMKKRLVRHNLYILIENNLVYRIHTPGGTPTYRLTQNTQSTTNPLTTHDS